MDRIVDRDGQAPAEGPLRLLGDTSLIAALRTALPALVRRAGAGGDRGAGRIGVARGSVGLDVYLSRRPIGEAALEAAGASTNNTRAFLWVEIVWGRGIVGPLVRPAMGDACVHAIEHSGSELDGTPGACTVAEPALLPGLVAAIASAEIEDFFCGETPATANGQIHVVPYAGWAAAPAPVLTRAGLPRNAACPSCGIDSEEAASERRRWAWLHAPAVDGSQNGKRR